MDTVTFLDIEVDPLTGKVQDIGAVREDGNSFHKNSASALCGFIAGSTYICGHNILNHDLRYIKAALDEAGINPAVIDTLHLSPLLFPARPYHALLKDDKLQSEEINNPLNDSIKARDLFYDEVSTFQQADQTLKEIFCGLLYDQRAFSAFFQYVGYTGRPASTEQLIREYYHADVCANADFTGLISGYPVELAYALALINCHDRYSITPRWVLMNYPEVDRAMRALRGNPCLEGCVYCNQALDIHTGLKRYFGHESFRTYNGEPLQERAVRAAVEGKSLLAVFPTGGGKSITFQVPALMSGAATKGLTVVISPLQSLMKDQVDNLERNGITDAVTINGLLDPIERGKSFERVEDGSATLLYLSPESLRSRSIERLLLGRKIVRFVIDEAHCFSSWGQDFRVDYLYIGDFIRQLQEKKNLADRIPVSCFTATAKKKVIEDICNYFREKLSLELEIFNSNATRTNLKYQVLEKSDAQEKYMALRNLIERKSCPTIIYVSRIRRAKELAGRLIEDGFNAKPYHGKMDAKEKTSNQDAFIRGEVPVMVATSAFGMGVDKKDIGMVIHYDISDSLENYIQEAGRAGRDEHITAECFVLFDEEDLGKHFILLNQTKLSIAEIQQVWTAIKEITRFRSTVSQSALEIARKAGWDDNVAQIETRVTSAIAALEDAGYLKRGQNMPRVFANSILAKNAQEAIGKINASERFEVKQKEKGIRIIKKLISSRSKKMNKDEQGESRIDHISDHLGIVKEEVINIINLLREEKILADAKDLTAFVKKGESTNRSLRILEGFGQTENFLMSIFTEAEQLFHLKELNEAAELGGVKEVNPAKIRTILNYWSIKHWISRKQIRDSRDHLVISCLHPMELMKERLKKRHALATFIVGFLYDLSRSGNTPSGTDEVLVEFSVHQLRDEFIRNQALFQMIVSTDEVEDALFFLSRIEALKIEGGFLVVYNQLTIDRLEMDSKRRYRREDYRKLEQFYENKVQQIHIVGEYAKKMIHDYKGALQFTDDYFRLNYTSFLNKYFPGTRQLEIRRNLTPSKFKQLFGSLSPEQLEIIKGKEGDREKNNIAVLAGPGSGKTRVLVHKLASLLLMEDVKHEQLLMLTFSRAAAGEFKKRLMALIGNAAHYVEIKTFHSYCFDLLGQVGSLQKSDAILSRAVEKIKNGEVETSRITKSVLVLDEAQDMNADEFRLVEVLMEKNDGMTVVAVGDDDQNIFEFRGSSSRFLAAFMDQRKAVTHELIRNYRSKHNLVEFSNGLIKRIHNRLKTTPIIADQPDLGKLRLVRYESENLISPLVHEVCSAALSGTTCVLTRSNEEAIQLVGLFLKMGRPAKLIRSNEGFGLHNLVEVRFLREQVSRGDDVKIISEEVWQKAKTELSRKFHRSALLDVCTSLIQRFEETTPKTRYRTDLEIFVRESSFEDLFNEQGETIVVSTIHKAKGKEFDNVYVMLANLNPDTDEAMRQLYVAFTRAKENLSIHLNGDYLDNINAENLEYSYNFDQHLPPDELVLQLTYRDVWLDYFIARQTLITGLMSGDALQIEAGGCKTLSGNSVLKFSKQLNNLIEDKKERGYLLRSATVNFIVYWKKENSDQEILIVLPQLHFERAVGR